MMLKSATVIIPECDETDNFDDEFCDNCGERLPDPLNMPTCPFCGVPTR